MPTKPGTCSHGLPKSKAGLIAVESTWLTLRSGPTVQWVSVELRVSEISYDRTVLTLPDYANYHTGFNSLFRGKRLTGILTDLMGEQAVLFKEKINYKEAGGSGGFDAHIDAK